jgi:tetratricopeptide (TPR) repeat protein
MPAIAEDDGESFSKTVRALQDSFNKTVSDSKNLKDENIRLANELAAVKKELADSGNYKDRVAELEKQISEINTIKRSKEEELSKMKTRMEETEKEQGANRAKVDLYMKRIEKLQGELQEAQKGQVKAEQLQQSKRTVTELTKEIEKNRQETGRFHYNLGNVYFRNGEYQKAAYEYEQALKLIPSDADVYYNLAIIYDFHLGDGKKAFDLYEQHLNLNPKSEMSDFIKERISETSLKAKMATN